MGFQRLRNDGFCVNIEPSSHAPSQKELAMTPLCSLRTVFGLVALMLSMASSAAQGDAETIAVLKKTFQERLPAQKVIHVVPSAFDGLYEVFLGTQILYSNKTADYVLNGTLFDGRTKRDLTAARLNELNRIDFHSLPFEHAIKVVKGDGTRQLAVFSDPDCPYCKELEKELVGLTNVTIYTFLYPLKSIHPEAAEKAHAIWCSPDRAAAWTRWMLKGKLATSKACDGDPTDGLVELGTKLNVVGTPTLYFTTGKRMMGGLSAQQISDLLDQSLAESASKPVRQGAVNPGD